MTPYLTGTDGAREDLCRYLAACHYEPTTDFAEERLFDAIQVAAGAIDPELGASASRLAAAFETADLQDLLVDYTALFIGPSQPRAMPYASFWLSVDPSARHEAMMAVADLYDEAGFEVGEDVHEFLDHVAIELEFLYALLFRHNEARGSGDDEAMKNTSTFHRKFLQGHLAAWITPFSDAVRAGTKTAFYKELADLTERFVRTEAARP